MTTRPSSKEARRLRSQRDREVVAWYQLLMMEVFPHEFSGKRRYIHRDSAEAAEINARINAYQSQALAGIPIQYIHCSVRLALPTSLGSQQ